MKIVLIADALTCNSLSNYIDNNLIGSKKNDDVLFVESAWQGRWNRWKYKIASYPDHPERNNDKLKRLVQKAKDRGIPTVFWNKEDGVHFDRFIDSAKLFDHVFTVDENCIPRYKEVMGQDASVHTMMFAVQPKFHYFDGFNFKYNRANFVGSYSHHVHEARRLWQNKLINSVTGTGLGLTVFDRNSKRKSSNYRYPIVPGMEIKKAVKYPKTGQVYKDYLVSLNVNTVTDSPTMFSRRLVEILACGGIAVTTPAESVDKMFAEYCHVVHDEAEMWELFARLKHGPSKDDLERARAGAEYVAKYHTWEHRLDEMARIIGLK